MSQERAAGVTWPVASAPAARWVRAWRRTTHALLSVRIFGGHNFLDLPITHKLSVASAVILALGIAGTYWVDDILLVDLLGEGAKGETLHLALFVVAAILMLAVLARVNTALVRTALSPLASLQHTVEAVRRGDQEARAAGTLFSDPGMELLRAALNDMLDHTVRDRARLHSLSAGLLTAQEEERKRVARDLHDDVGQIVTALLVHLKRSERFGSSPEARAALQEAQEMAAAASEAVRRVAYQMRPSILDDLGLVAALRAVVDDLCERDSRTRADFQAIGLEERLPPSVEVRLYRVVREALANIERHAQAPSIKVHLERRGSEVQARVEDDGVGFDVRQALRDPEAAVGLLGMRERIAILGGTLRIDSRPGQGTSVQVRIPLS